MISSIGMISSLFSLLVSASPFFCQFVEHWLENHVGIHCA
jgi:ABC-type methionine transport system permease subunit